MSQTPPGPAFPFHRAPPPRKRPLWRTLAWIVVAVLVAVIAGCLLTPHAGGGHGKRGGGGSGGAGGPGGGGGRTPTVVGIATAVKGDIPVTISAIGTVTSEQSVTLDTQIAGVLMKIDFSEGQLVRKGQLLAEVDTRPYVVALAQADGALARDQASLANARLDLTRYQTLAKQDSISGQQVDTQAALVRQDEGVVKTDQAAVASAKLNLTYCHLIAPMDGRVGLRQVDAGNYITSGTSTGVVVITKVDPIDVAFSLPEDDIPQVAARTGAGAVLSVTAFDRAGVNNLGQGTLLTLDNQVDTTTGTIKAKARFDNAKGMLFPNQFVNVSLLVDTVHDAVVVPAQAVRHGSDGDYVFELGQDPDTGGPIARQVNVKVGPIDGERVSITSGVAVGDKVVTDGGDRLTDGATVLLPGQIPPTPRAKPSGFFGWLASLFGHKPAADQGGSASAGGGGGYGGGSGGGAGGGSGGGAGRMQAMFAQLDLTPNQQKKIAALQADMRQKMQAAGDDPDARRTARQAVMKQINAILTPAQQDKLNQLRAQARASYGGGGQGGASGGAGSGGGDASAVSSASASGGDQGTAAQSPASASPAASSAGAPSASPQANNGQGGGYGGGGHGGGGRMQAMFAQLDLTPDQTAKIQAIQADIRQKMQGAGDDPDARRALMHGALDRINQVLTPQQQAKLAQLRAAARAQAGGSGGGYGGGGDGGGGGQ